MDVWYCFFFFFSSRRRHTRLTCDWSSDVCSSDLRVRGRSPRHDDFYFPLQPSHLPIAAQWDPPSPALGGTFGPPCRGRRGEATPEARGEGFEEDTHEDRESGV